MTLRTATPRAFVHLAACAALIAAAAAPAAAQASPDVPVGHPVYELLDALDTAGEIHTRLSGQRPYSRAEVARLLYEASDSLRGRDDALVAWVHSLSHEFRAEVGRYEWSEAEEVDGYWKPIEGVAWMAASRTGPMAPERMQGRTIVKGAQFFGRFETHAAFGPVAAWLEPELRIYPDHFGPDDESEVRARLVTGAVRGSLLGMDLTAGRITPDWGPRPPRGGDGLVFTPNPQPLSMVSLKSSEPVLLPWIFENLGPVGVEVMAGVLEKGRDVQHALVGGIRIGLRPWPGVELGLTRAFLFGGEDRPINVGRMLTAEGENVDDPSDRDLSDQLAGGDLRLRVPLPFGAGLAVYGEGFGEDEAGGYPSKWSWRAGVHLAGLPPARGLELRVEWARLHRSAYGHGVYTSGWTYRGVGIGHHLGAGNDGVAAEAATTLALGRAGLVRFTTFAVHELRGKLNRPGFPGEQSRRVGGGAEWQLRTGARLGVEGWVLGVRRAGGVHGREDTGAWLAITAGYRF